LLRTAFDAEAVSASKLLPATCTACCPVFEIPDPSCLDIKLLLNGKTLQESNTRHLIFGVAQIIAYASALIPLKPGDVIATGTPSGVGFSRTPPIFMKAGDICEVQIEKIGTLRNKVEKAVG